VVAQALDNLAKRDLVHVPEQDHIPWIEILDERMQGAVLLVLAVVSIHAFDGQRDDDVLDLVLEFREPRPVLVEERGFLDTAVCPVALDYHESIDDRFELLKPEFEDVDFVTEVEAIPHQASFAVGHVELLPVSS
jgi:hypothetical protein